MNRAVRYPGLWLAGGIAAALLLAALVLSTLTGTERGRERILEYTLTALGGRLNGSLEAVRLEGNVVTGARLYEVSLRGADGEPLMVADSAYIQYELPTFLGGDVVINQLVVYRARLTLVRAPGDSLWNYQRVLRDTTPDGGPGRATLIERLRLVDADVLVRMPWEPDEDLSGPARRRTIERALSDTSRLVVERVPGGFQRIVRIDVEEAVLSPLTVASNERGGTYLEVEDAAGEVFLYQDVPLRVAGLQGEVALRSGLLRYDARTIVLPGSTLASAGSVDVTGGDPRYDLVFNGTDVDLEDLQWLYPPIPDRGAITARLWLETRPEGLFFLVREGLLTAPDTRVWGDFGMVVGDTLQFVEVELTARPLNVETVRQMIPGGLPVRGLRIGSVTIDSPAS